MRALREALRDPVRGPRIVAGVWIVLVFVLWNLLFERLLIAEMDRFREAAVPALRAYAPLSLDAWMDAAIDRSLWTASLVSGGVLIAGLIPLMWLQWTRSATR